MNISIFARGMGHRPTGRGFLAHEFAKALPALDPELRLQIFAGEPIEWPGAEVRLARGSNFLSDLWRVFVGVGRDVRAWGPDVLWSASHFLPRNLPPRLPKVVTLLDLVWRDHPESMGWRNRLGAGRLEQGLFRADRIACISGFTRDRLVHHFPELAPKASVVPLAANARLAASTPRPEVVARLGLDRPYVINVDTVEPRKNLPVLFEAMRARPDLVLLQCGGVGWKAGRLLEHAASVPNVRLLGYVPEADLADLYRGAVASASPSIYEGFHLPPLDAASLGCPVVASDIPVHREVLGDGALYHAVGDAEGLGRNLDRLAGDPAYRAEKGAELKRRSAAFTWESFAARLLALFRELLEGSH